MIGQIQTVKKHDSYVRARFSAQTELKHVVMNDVYRVHEDMGMALTPGKLLASSPRNIYQSVFLKLPTSLAVSIAIQTRKRLTRILLRHQFVG